MSSSRHARRGAGGLRFSGREVRDLAVALVVISFAFAVFFAGGGPETLALLGSGAFLGVFVVNFTTAGFAFLLHELAHKVVAVRFGQVAEFRADYSMLFLAVMSALIGFIFAAPGAVHHRGRISERQHGLVALAGPATNVLLAVLFVPVLLFGVSAGSSFVADVGQRGIVINLILAAFNLIPFGSLDGATVFRWSKVVFALTFLPTAAVAYVVLFGGI